MVMVCPWSKWKKWCTYCIRTNSSSLFQRWAHRGRGRRGQSASLIPTSPPLSLSLSIPRSNEPKNVNEDAIKNQTQDPSELQPFRKMNKSHLQFKSYYVLLYSRSKSFLFYSKLGIFQLYPLTPFYDPNLTIITSWTKLN